MPTDDLNDVWKKFEEQDALLQKQVYIKEDHIVINVMYEYDIPIERCNTPDKLLAWMVHLCEKTWMNTAVLERFAQVAAQKSGISLVLA